MFSPDEWAKYQSAVHDSDSRMSSLGCQPSACSANADERVSACASEGCGAGSAPARPWLSGLVWITVDEDERQRRLRARPDWPTYAPWAGMWARQERAQRAGEDPWATADAVVETGPDATGPLRLTWRDR